MHLKFPLAFLSLHKCNRCKQANYSSFLFWLHNSETSSPLSWLFICLGLQRLHLLRLHGLTEKRTKIPPAIVDKRSKMYRALDCWRCDFLFLTVSSRAPESVAYQRLGLLLLGWSVSLYNYSLYSHGRAAEETHAWVHNKISTRQSVYIFLQMTKSEVFMLWAHWLGTCFTDQETKDNLHLILFSFISYC